ncbi:MAG: glutamine--fructose-6-phosphate transaminase (isomerizing), partial [Armatimonadota bacterium]
MCGIVGYVGKRQATDICIQSLHCMEYRGYDSAGVAVITDDGQLVLRRAVGKLTNLENELAADPVIGSLGLGHTRWATHGKPNVANSHPHLSCDGRIAVVHNGIIENYQELRAELEAEGHTFKSQTDTEVMAHLVEKYFKGDLRAAVIESVNRLRGAFAFGIISADAPGELVAVRRRSPLVVGIGQGENFIASDMPAIRSETDQVYVIDDDEMALITADKIELTTLDLKPIDKDIYVIPWPADAAGKGGYDHFMHKEIHEQPNAIYACLAGRLTSADAPVKLEGLNLTVDEIKKIRKIVFTACGTAYHSGLIGRFVMEKLAKIPAEADLAPELRSRSPIVLEDTLVIAVTQSGETMDTLLALRDMREKGAKVISVVNVVDSTIARESDGVVYIQAGPEIGVASTKAYTLQILTIELIALYFAEVRGAASAEELKAMKTALLAAPDAAETLLAREDSIIAIAKKYADCRRDQWSKHGVAIENGDQPAEEKGWWSTTMRRDAMRPNALYLARGVNLASGMEGALKLKEISYIHAEGYSAGEMKHGPIALVEPSLFTVAIAVEGEVKDQMVANIMEIKARSGPVIAVATDGDTGIEGTGVDAAASPDDVASQPNDMIWIPSCPELVSPILVGIPLQLLAYHIAKCRGEHIDQPRNL